METPFKELCHICSFNLFHDNIIFNQLFFIPRPQDNSSSKDAKKDVQTYDINIRKAVHNSFWYNMKQLSRVLKSNNSKKMWKMSKKSFVTEFVQ